MRLRLGRFARELYYARTRAVLPREEVKRRLALVCGHLGYVTGIFEYIMTDMFYLRIFSICGCGLIVGYQAAQPRILWVPTLWNAAFTFINIYQLRVLTRRLPAMSDEEQLLYAALGGEERLEQQIFQEVLEVGTWKFLDAEEKLAEEGLAAVDAEVCLLASGSCEVQLGSLLLGRLGPGSIIGEVWELAPDADCNAPKPASATVMAGNKGARCFCIPLKQLQNNPKLHEALHGIFATALADKILNMNQDRRLLQYKAVLEVACSAGPDPPPAVLAAVAGYRRQHGVTDEEHFRATQAVPRCVSSRLIRA